MHIMADKDMLYDIGSRCLAVRTISAARAITRSFDECFRPVDLTTTQFSLLASIGGLHPESITELADQLSLDRTSATRNLRLLEKAGLVQRSDEGAARKRSIELTEDGWRRLREAYPLWKKFQKQLEKALDDELDATKSALSVLRRHKAILEKSESK